MGRVFYGKIDWGEKLELKIRMLPESPGCYLMKDKDGTIIYVGKAVNLKTASAPTSATRSTRRKSPP